MSINDGPIFHLILRDFAFGGNAFRDSPSVDKNFFGQAMIIPPAP
jgi:hypothetical protein